MERADSTLENFVKASSLSDESKINIIRQIVHTISLVHQRGVLHRDLSPTNIFLWIICDRVFFARRESLFIPCYGWL